MSNIYSLVMCTNTTSSTFVAVLNDELIKCKDKLDYIGFR